jgi:plastocyanin
VVDTGTTPVDTGTTPTDTGTTPTDTGTTPMDTAMPTKHTVTVGSSGGANTFSPANLTIKVGDTVEWVWAGAGHTVTQAASGSCAPMSGGFDSGLHSAPFNFSHTFTAAGTVNYICTPHCALGMTGSVTVTP